MSFPILEYDEDRSSITMPDPFALDFSSRVPARGVLCFFQDVIDELVSLNQLTVIGYLRSEIGKHPVYQYANNSESVTVFSPWYWCTTGSSIFRGIDLNRGNEIHRMRRMRCAGSQD